jgi:hypothetical protein
MITQRVQLTADATEDQPKLQLSFKPPIPPATLVEGFQAFLSVTGVVLTEAEEEHFNEIQKSLFARFDPATQERTYNQSRLADMLKEITIAKP